MNKKPKGEVKKKFKIPKPGALYSCFEKGCPTKTEATMPKNIMGNGGSWFLDQAFGRFQ